MIKLFIGGFPLEMTELELVQLVSPHGTVETIKIVRDRKTHICKGYAFLEMKNREGAETAVAMLNKTKLAGRELTLNIEQGGSNTSAKTAPKLKRPRIPAR